MSASTMEKLLGPRLYQPSTKAELATSEVLQSRQYVLLYFGAGWCSNCADATAALKGLNELLAKKEKTDTQIIYVSSDRSEEAFVEVVKDFPWVALPFRQRRAKHRVLRKFHISAVPTCLILEVSTGAIVCAEPLEELQADRAAEHFPWSGKTVWGILGTTHIFSQSGERIPLSRLRGCEDGIALYFGALWSSRCRLFTPRLAAMYAKMRGGTSMDVVFVSADHTERAYDEHRATMPWAALGWKDPATGALSRVLKVSAMPTLVTIRPDGSIVNADAQCDASEDPAGERWPWPKEELPFVSPLVSSSEVVEALTTGICFTLCRNGAGNFDVSVAEFSAAANRLHAQRLAAKKNSEDADDVEPLHFFIASEEQEIVDRVFEAFAAPKVANGQSLILATSVLHDRKKELFTGDVSMEMVLSFVERYIASLPN